MLREKKKVQVGDLAEDKQPVYEKRVPESSLDGFLLVVGEDKTKLNDAQIKAITALDSAFPKVKEDGKEVPNPILDDFLGHFSYGFDLYMKSKTRREYEKTVEDPIKPVLNGIKAMILNGFDAGMAYDLTAQQRTAKGLTTPAKEEVLAKLK